MAEKSIGEIVGRQAPATATPETGASAAGESASAKAGETSAEQGAVTVEDPIAGLKSALDKERDRANRFEKDWKKAERTQKQRDQHVQSLEQELGRLRATVHKPDQAALENEFYTKGPEFVTGQLSAYEQRRNAERTRERLELSQELARDRYEDYDDAEAAFVEAANKTPALWQEMASRRAPAFYAYKKGKEILAFSGAESTSTTAAEQRIAKLEAQIEALSAGRDGGQTDDGAETAPAAEKKPSIPRSNAGSRGSGVGKTSSWAGPTPLSKVYGRHRAAR
jgi:chromosome segregation ATPase